MTSPFTYMTKTPIVALYIPLPDLLRQFESFSGRVILNVKNKLSENLDHLNRISIKIA